LNSLLFFFIPFLNREFRCGLPFGLINGMKWASLHWCDQSIAFRPRFFAGKLTWRRLLSPGSPFHSYLVDDAVDDSCHDDPDDFSLY